MGRLQNRANTRLNTSLFSSVAFVAIITVAVQLSVGLPTAHAAGGRSSVGLNLGAVLPSASSSALGWGVDFLYGLSAFSVGGFYSKYGVGLDVNNDSAVASVQSSTTLYGVFGRYDFSGSLQNFYGTFRLGFGKTAATLTATSVSSGNRVTSDASSSSMIFGPGLGYDQPVGTSFTLGGELRYVTGLSENAAKSLSLLFSAKFWF